MDKQLDFGAFLAAQTSEGSVDSQGEFTISQRQASQKLAKFALPRSTSWVSKLVQAAVGWRCKEIRIRQTKTETFFHFAMRDIDQIPSESHFLSHILSGNIGDKEPIDSFCLALRALVEQANLSFILVANDGKASSKPIYAGSHYSELSEKERLSSRFRPGTGLWLTVYHYLSAELSDVLAVVNGARGAIPIINELDSYCYPSPIPIILEGRRIDSLVVNGALSFSQTNRPIYFGGIKDYLEHSPARLPLPEDFETKSPSLLTTPRRLRRTYCGSSNFQAVYVLSLNIDAYAESISDGLRSSNVVWLNDGIVVEKDLLHVTTRGISLTIFANASGLATDLTGFSLIRTKPYFARRREIMQCMYKVFSPFQLDIDNLFKPDLDNRSRDDIQYDEEMNTKNRIKRIIAGSGVGLALTLINPILGVPTTLGSIVMPYVYPPTDINELIAKRSYSIKKIIALDTDAYSKFFRLESGTDLREAKEKEEIEDKLLQTFLSTQGIDKEQDFNLRFLSDLDPYNKKEES